MTTLKRYSHKKIDSETALPFSAIEYSKFKHGDKSLARKFGCALGKSFAQSDYFQEIVKLSLDQDKRIVVISAPYDFIPTASFHLKDFFLMKINEELMNKGVRPAMEAKIYRKRSYNHDYGGLSHADRQKSISGDGFYVDASFLNDKIVIFIDDVRISGAHEDRILAMIKKHKITAPYYMLYYAEVINKDINPKLENKINYAGVKSVIDISKIIRKGNFVFNTRNIKFLLNSDQVSFYNFIVNQSEHFVTDFFHCSIGNYYYEIPEYKENFSVLLKLHNEQKL